MKRWTGLFVMALVSVTGCGGGGADECTMATTGESAKFVANSISVPQSKSDFAFDLNGDGRADNQLGNIIQALTNSNLDTQSGVNDAVTDGNVLLLIDANADSLANSSCASSEVGAGKVMMNPDFTGNGTFTKDTAVAGGVFKGKIANNVFTSNNPATTTNPISVTILLPLVSGAEPVALHVQGARLTWTKMGDQLVKGQINGAVKSEDIQMTVIPNIAKLLSNLVAEDPDSSSNKQILQLFDVGDGADGTCTGVDGVTGTGKDGKIAACEVADNALIKNVLAPDVQMFQGGEYKPNKANSEKDSLSLGLGFTAVKANF